MHPSVLAFASKVLWPRHVTGKRVLEVGAYDVNGSVRPAVEALNPQCYVGVDMSPGPGVDVIADCEALTMAVGVGCWDLVICTEMLEHAANWQTCIDQMIDALTPDGYLLLTTRSPGFPYHPFPQDHWRFTRTDVGEILVGAGLWLTVLEDDDPDTPGVLALAHKPASWLPHTDRAWKALVINTVKG